LRSQRLLGCRAHLIIELDGQEQSVRSIGTLARKGRNGQGLQDRERTGEGLNGALPEGKGKWERE
jgi:hypothetical protein